ncbi:MAG: hypothetical protein H6556_00125 [Lewinellaceae bacterium]|nr:hypothetical protein [Lewinellaceae bacterium]
MEDFANLFDHQQKVKVSFQKDIECNIREALLADLPDAHFDISPKDGNNILLNITTESCLASALWLLVEKQLKILKLCPKEQNPDKWEKTREYGQPLGFSVLFSKEIDWRAAPFDLSLTLKNGNPKNDRRQPIGKAADNATGSWISIQAYWRKKKRL